MNCTARWPALAATPSANERAELNQKQAEYGQSPVHSAHFGSMLGWVQSNYVCVGAVTLLEMMFTHWSVP